MDGLLLLVEIAGVVGFLFLLFNGMNLIRDLNREVATVLEQPTLTPTPLVVAVVLPSGHTPPNAEGGTRPNDAEIPEPLDAFARVHRNLRERTGKLAPASGSRNQRAAPLTPLGGSPILRSLFCA